MGRIGEALREARESKNLTLRDAENATKIRMKYLEDLENENFANLPGRAYAIGFLKTYAKYLQIEDQALVEEYKATNRTEEYLQNQRVKSSVTKTIVKDFQSKLYRILLIVVAIALLVGTNFLYNKMRNKDNHEQVNPLLPDVIAEDPNPNQDADTEPPLGEENADAFPQESSSAMIDKIKISIKISSVANSECWINIVADNTKVFSGIMTEGEAREFVANEVIKVTFGNAGVAQVIVNEQDLGVMGIKGQVVTKEFKKSDFYH